MVLDDPGIPERLERLVGDVGREPAATTYPRTIFDGSPLAHEHIKLLVDFPFTPAP